MTDRKKKYLEYLKSPEWKTIRVEMISFYKNTCQRCRKRFPPWKLHVHHLTYDRLGMEEPEDLELLCAECHRYEHLPKKKKKRMEAKPPPKVKKKKKKNRRKSDTEKRWDKMRDKFGFGNI